MPEGDTILRTARTLARALEGRAVIAFRSTAPRLARHDLVGRRIARIEARGKNLLLHFDDGRALQTHMRMTGAWHLYRPGEKWWKPEHLARAVIETDAFVAVCFQAPVVELLSAAELARHPLLASLGPDILAADFDRAIARERLRALGGLSVGEAILDQSAIAGIGNIYKSEALFAARIDPFVPVQELRDADLDRLLETARKQMLSNLGPSPRRTRTTLGGPRFRVYGRSGKACPECGEKIRMRRQGRAGRSTYWCPVCQSVHIIRA